MMPAANSYKNFLQGRYFNEGIRMTAGIALPAIIFGYFNLLNIGVILSTGALCVSVTDSPGPLHHRVNGMFFCNIVIAIVSIISYLCFYSVITTSLEILFFGFIFSMLSVYNARVSSVGLSALLIMILSMQTVLQGNAIIDHTLYLLAGGFWYMVFSILLNTLRPYKIIQQLSGDFIADVAQYLNTRASFYEDHPDYESIYRSLLQQQVKVQTQQAMLSELLFKTRAVTKNSTQLGRSLLKIYLDVTDLFESIMSTYQQYEILHNKFDETGILTIYREQLLLLSAELTVIANAVRAGNRSQNNSEINNNFIKTKDKFQQLRKNFMTGHNVKDFIALGRILNNIKALTEKINGLHYYTAFDKKNRLTAVGNTDPRQFTEAQSVDPSLFMNNLNFGSNIFRHSLRVSVSLFAGYMLSLFFNIGHSYWILLTIVVILKPAYSLTKSRNADRLIGTLLGIIAGVALVFLIKNNNLLLVIMIVFMIASYSFMRIKYFWSVLFLTPYLVIFFHLLSPEGLGKLLTDRLVDTGLGSAIAFLSSLFFVPVWEHAGIKNYMLQMLEKNVLYFSAVAAAFTGEDRAEQEFVKKARQQTLTALANLSDAFNRMLSEPRRYQKNAEIIYRFVVLNHIITSHFSALAFFIKEQKNVFVSASFLPVAEATRKKFEMSKRILENDELPAAEDDDNGILAAIQDETTQILSLRKKEIAAGDLETETKTALINAGSVADQFTHIYNLGNDIEKNVKEFAAI